MIDLRKSFALPLVLLHASIAFAGVRLPHIFSSHMVLQHQAAVPFWGWAAPGEMVRIRTSWGASATSFAGVDGKWRATLISGKAGGPYTVTVMGSNTIEFDDVMLGEVWVCSGQSNMEKWVGQQPGQRAINRSSEEIAAANYPDIRLITLPRVFNDTPQEDFEGQWQRCSPETIPTFSAVAYFFGREINHKLGVPVGLISTNYGGTEVELWVSDAGLSRVPEFWERIEKKEGLRQVFEKNLRKWRDAVRVSEPMGPHWKEESFDDSKWNRIATPMPWTKIPKLATLLGTGLFRATFIAPDSWEGKEVALNLGAIDDEDVTYVNGKMVGSLHQWNLPRTYKVEAGIVHAGKNIVAIQMLNPFGEGGFNPNAGALPKPEDINISFGNTKVALRTWRFIEGSTMSRLPPMPTNHERRHAELFNAMIHPIVPYAMRGAIWYQGESNVDRAHQYESLFPALIADWRNSWGRRNFPFYFVQIAPCSGYQTDGSSSELRDAQRKTLKLRNTGMAVTTDITGDINDIHPTNKQDVGRRLALWAFAGPYGLPGVEASGPLYKSMYIKADGLHLRFTHTTGGLIARGTRLKGFTISGRDRRFYPAEAVIQGTEVLVRSERVGSPVAVRFAWADSLDQNLFNGTGLPASPFRTDNWPAATSNSK